MENNELIPKQIIGMTFWGTQKYWDVEYPKMVEDMNKLGAELERKLLYGE